MPYPNFLAGQILTADDLMAGQTTAIRKDVRQTVNNSSAFVDADAITFEAAANGEYEVHLYAMYTSSSTADIKFDWVAPSGSTMRRHTWAADLTSNDVNNTNLRLRGGATGTEILAGSGNGVTTYREAIHLVMGSTPGTVKLRFAQNTANASDTSLREETWFTWQRVG